MDIETWPWIRPFAELLNFGGNWLGLMQHCTGTKKHSLIFHPLSLGGTPPLSVYLLLLRRLGQRGGEIFSFSGAVTGSLSGMCLGASLISSTAPPPLQASFLRRFRIGSEAANAPAMSATPHPGRRLEVSEKPCRCFSRFCIGVPVACTRLFWSALSE